MWKSFCLDWFIAFISLLLLDALWLSNATTPLYTPVFKKITKSNTIKFRMQYGLIAWLLLALAIALFLSSTHKRMKTRQKKLEISLFSIGRAGFFMGLIIYGVYNTTNLATFQKYTTSLALTDTLWGSFAMTVATLVTYSIHTVVTSYSQSSQFV